MNREGNMAFTELDVRDATESLAQTASQEDLFRLGLIYSTDLEDRGPDFVEAHKWFSLAAMLGSIPAKAYREELKQEMTASELTLAQRAARGWLKENRELLAA
jgi:TPR repeat protein